jgi:hypothetical protein
MGQAIVIIKWVEQRRRKRNSDDGLWEQTANFRNCMGDI